MLELTGKFTVCRVEGERGTWLLRERAPRLPRRAGAALVEAIARATGYPRARLRPELHWETDLGVDRTKRAKVALLLASDFPEAMGLVEAFDGSGGTLGDWARALGARREELPEEFGAAPGPASPEIDSPGGIPEFPASEADVTELLVQIVQEKTGYARELLDLDADLEADLGIDTIKQAQIVGQLRRRYPVRFQDGLRIKDFPTLRHWIDFTVAQMRGGGGGGVIAASGAVAPFALERLGVVFREAPLASREAPLSGGPAISSWLLTDDGRGVAARLEAALRERGARVVRLADAAPSLEDFDGVLHLAPLGGESAGLARECLAFAAPERVRAFLVATAGAGSGSGAAAGFTKSLAAERPGVFAKALGFERGESAAAMAAAILGELSGGTGVEVRWSGDRRLEAATEPRPLDLSRDPVFVPDSSTVILISGGAKGVGAAVALDLARRFRPKLAILGRSAEDGVSGVLRELRGAGAETLYLSCDVADAGAVERACAEVRARLGAIGGLIHAAGVIEDAPLAEKTAASLDRVFAVKLGGLENLLEHSKPAAFVALFSSVAARYGNPRQCDYAAANEAAARVAESYASARTGVRALTIDWAAWDETGMAARTGVADVLKTAGEGVIGVREGVDAFREELLFSPGGEVVVRPARAVVKAPEAVARAIETLAEAAALGRAKLLDSALEFERGRFLLALKRLEPARERWLSDHTLFEYTVMPATFGIELMAQAAVALFPGFRFAGLRELRIDSGIPLIGQDTLPIQLRAEARAGSSPDEREARVSIEMAGARRCYTATILLARELPLAGETPVGALSQSAAGAAMNPAAIYERMKFGASFHVIEEYQPAAPEGAIAKLGSKTAHDFVTGGGEFESMPIPLEGAFQSAALLRLLERDVVLVPRSLRELRIHRRAESEAGLRISVFPREGAFFDLYIHGPDGALCASALGYETMDITEISKWKNAE
jgi:NAD(P)-dependent dehydrogenase (short-subunit alcohol dehydrogenase family)